MKRNDTHHQCLTLVEIKTYLGNEVSEQESEVFDAHFSTCELCNEVKASFSTVNQLGVEEDIVDLKEELFEKNVIDNLVRIVIPKDRSCMHIDTVFTQISELEYVIYKDILLSDILKITKYNKDGSRKEFSTLEEFFLDYNPKMKFILCGNGDETYGAREQWTDGCNLLALMPGVAIGYDRNTVTSTAFKSAGYEVYQAKTFIRHAIENNLSGDDFVDKKMILLLPSGELSRARGGSHCMSMPLLRDDI